MLHVLNEIVKLLIVKRIAFKKVMNNVSEIAYH